MIKEVWKKCLRFGVPSNVAFNDYFVPDVKISSARDSISAIKVWDNGSIETRLMNVMYDENGKLILNLRDEISSDESVCNAFVYQER